MLTPSQRERILSHLERGWKLPDSLVQELWSAYEALEQTQQRPGSTAHPEHETKTHQPERRSVGGRSGGYAH
jgi:hypothetical protein